MASVIVTLRIMPESVESDLAEIETKAAELIRKFSGETDIKAEKMPIAFGLKSLNITFIMDESIGSTEELEKNISEIDHIVNVECIDVRRAVG